MGFSSLFGSYDSKLLANHNKTAAMSADFNDFLADCEVTRR